MSYLTRLDELRRAELYQRAREFAEHYDPALPSVIVLPGGMGSRLMRNNAPYDPATRLQIETFYELWLDIVPLLRGELASLASNEYSQERDQHPVIAQGELSSVVKTYDGVFDFFAGKANAIGMGYDWRRTPDKECEYVRVFLLLIAEQVKKRNPAWEDPRRRLTLYAHSQGGLVAKLFLNSLAESGEDPDRWCERLVTCCTPFYGTQNHFPRYYIGEPMLNAFTGGADAVARIVASFEGPYILLPAPREVLQPRLAALGLTRYPVRDFDDDAMECDPFDRAPAIKGRYRPELPRAHLVSARDQFKLIDLALPAAFSQRIFHIRSDLNGAAAGGETLELKWKSTDGAIYDASHGNPISDNAADGARGDGTVPLWSARLGSATPDKVFDVCGVRHGGAAEHPEMLGILWNLMRGVAVSPGARPAVTDFDYAPASEVPAIGAKIIAAQDPRARLDALPAAEYRAFIDSLSLG